MKKIAENIAISAVLLIFAVIVVFPVLFMLVRSLTGDDGFTADGYKALFTDGGTYFFMYLRSLTAASAVTIGQTAVSVAVGFLLGRFCFRGKLILLAAYTAVQFLPYSATLLPNYMVIRELGLLNTQWSIILPAVFSPLGVIIMTIFISAVPAETLDAALLETKNIAEILWHIILPQVTPGIALTVVITFTEAWNMVEQPQAMIENRLLHPLSVSLGSIFSDGGSFAGSFLYIIPPILLLWSCRDSLRDGILTSTRKEKADG